LLLAVAALAVTGQNIFKQKFNDKCKSGTFFFTGMIAVFAMIFFIAVNRDSYYSAKLIGPSAAFALSYASATLFAVLAIRYGSLAKSCLIISFSLLVPSFYGILFLHEPISPELVVGTILLIVSLVLINYEKEKAQEKAPLKWYIFVLLAFLGNGMCSTVQKAKQEVYGIEGDNIFMIIALAMVAVLMFVMSMCFREERATVRETVRYGFLWAILCGLANGLTNYLVIYLNLRLPASTLFPVISSGSLVLSFLYSIFVVREKFSARQYVGFAIGVVSIVLLNL
jgi:drug/metabolite transporter (DMT)-like permease